MDGDSVGKFGKAMRSIVLDSTPSNTDSIISMSIPFLNMLFSCEVRTSITKFFSHFVDSNTVSHEYIFPVVSQFKFNSGALRKYCIKVMMTGHKENVKEKTACLSLVHDIFQEYPALTEIILIPPEAAKNSVTISMAVEKILRQWDQYIFDAPNLLLKCVEIHSLVISQPWFAKYSDTTDFFVQNDYLNVIAKILLKIDKEDEISGEKFAFLHNIRSVAFKTIISELR